MNPAPDNTHRLFIAFELPACAKERLARIIAQLKDECHRADIAPRAIKWVNAGNMHLTTQFLGDIRRSQIPAITEAVTDIYRQTEPHAFTLDSKALGAFPNLKRPRVIWADLFGADLTRMTDTVRSITDSLVSIKCPCDTKRFKPHLTLGRVRRDAGLFSLQAVTEKTTFKPLEIVFGTLTLFRSELTPRGPIHTALHNWNFGVK